MIHALSRFVIMMIFFCSLFLGTVSALAAGKMCIHLFSPTNSIIRIVSHEVEVKKRELLSSFKIDFEQSLNEGVRVIPSDKWERIRGKKNKEDILKLRLSEGIKIEIPISKNFGEIIEVGFLSSNPNVIFFMGIENIIFVKLYQKITVSNLMKKNKKRAFQQSRLTEELKLRRRIGEQYKDLPGKVIENKIHLIEKVDNEKLLLAHSIDSGSVIFEILDINTLKTIDKVTTEISTANLGKDSSEGLFYDREQKKIVYYKFSFQLSQENPETFLVTEYEIGHP